MNIGDKIKEQRLKKGWTQEQLGQLLNVSRPTISSWEIGRNYPDLETIIAISDLFGISLDHLLREDKEMAKDTTKKIKNGRIYKYVLIGLADGLGWFSIG
ncbi:helix-turn-helix domain-containing protein [Enterococcus massiliensis]|uniref:helix-turn-helix domain-containing protein n=1 Tax=Enterococcus massiliensis TaxID=1640685 RepID=UPI0009E5B15B|nr:helix-turn-helix transcriptional regulator [Enterococcus massiliensis]